VKKILVFNPDKRPSAAELLAHPYVQRFSCPEKEVGLDYYVVPPLNDDIQLSVEDYRTALYTMITKKKQQIRDLHAKKLQQAELANKKAKQLQEEHENAAGDKLSDMDISPEKNLVKTRNGNYKTTAGDAQTKSYNKTQNAGSTPYAQNNNSSSKNLHNSSANVDDSSYGQMYAARRAKSAGVPVQKARHSTGQLPTNSLQKQKSNPDKPNGYYSNQTYTKSQVPRQQTSLLNYQQPDNQQSRNKSAPTASRQQQPSGPSFPTGSMGLKQTYDAQYQHRYMTRSYVQKQKNIEAQARNGSSKMSSGEGVGVGGGGGGVGGGLEISGQMVGGSSPGVGTRGNLRKKTYSTLPSKKYSGGGIHHTSGSEAQNKLGSYGQTFGVINQSSMDAFKKTGKF